VVDRYQVQAEEPGNLCMSRAMSTSPLRWHLETRAQDPRLHAPNEWREMWPALAWPIPGRVAAPGVSGPRPVKEFVVVDFMRELRW